MSGAPQKLSAASRYDRQDTANGDVSGGLSPGHGSKGHGESGRPADHALRPCLKPRAAGGLGSSGSRSASSRPGRSTRSPTSPGVRVGHTTLIEGGDVRTGVTWSSRRRAWRGRLRGAVPAERQRRDDRLEWVQESGLLTSPVAITNTHSVGVVRDALVAAAHRARPRRGAGQLPVVAETWDGRLNDIDGMHVTAEHVFAALDGGAGGAVAEGNVGGGTGMVCHGFKGGIGTASRGWPRAATRSASSCRRTTAGASRLAIAGVPVGRELGPSDPAAATTAGPPARSSSSSRPTRRCCRTSASGSPSAPRSASPARAEPARHSRRPRSSPSRPATAASADATEPHDASTLLPNERLRPALRRHDRGDRGGDRQRDARRRDDDGPAARPCTPSTPTCWSR